MEDVLNEGTNLNSSEEYLKALFSFGKEFTKFMSNVTGRKYSHQSPQYSELRQIYEKLENKIYDVWLESGGPGAMISKYPSNY